MFPDLALVTKGSSSTDVGIGSATWLEHHQRQVFSTQVFEPLLSILANEQTGEVRTMTIVRAITFEGKNTAAEALKAIAKTKN